MRLTPKDIIIPVLMIVMIITSCTPACTPCDDPELTEVGSSSTLRLQFEVSTAVRHSNGTAASSIAIASHGDNIPISLADSVTTNVYLTGIDTTSGVKCVELKGGFGLTCQNLGGGSAISLHGILPNPRQCLPLTRCCLKNNRIAIEDLSQFMRCPSGQRVQSGGIQVVGIVQSCEGRTDTAILSFEPMLVF
ncbi:MAG TPA: hypothetical protein PKD85_03675 [Saprospiraceae bacterium]|nr:hypothetical protein [Saprospiraceae bacterium]